MFKTRNNLGKKIKQQEEQIHIRSKAMEATADGIFIIDAQKDNFPVTYINQAFVAMTGYAKREILGRDYFLLYGSSADPRIVEEIKHTMREGLSFHGEMLNFQKDGRKYWNLLRITPIRDAKGKVTHYIGIQTDITLMRSRDLEIKEQREEILHVTRVGKMAEFVSSLAHEISQPLTAILAYSQAGIRMCGQNDVQLKEIFQYIVNDDQRASEVIKRLRALLKKSEPEMKDLDINTLIKETVNLISTDATVRNNALRMNLSNGLPLIYGDRIQLQQVLLNLISNSFDAMEGIKGAHEMSICSMLEGKDQIRVEVIDSGCGILEENMSKLFINFFTNKSDGLGMGLSISRSIIEAHGGHLEVKNNVSQGATFYFTLPVKKE